MKLTHLKPMIWTTNLKETVDFYTDILGFACTGISEEYGWASVLRDHVEIMMAVPNVPASFENPAFTGSFYITSTNIEHMWEELKDRTKIAYPIDNFKYGMREFAIYDNNGYLIQFGQRIAEVEDRAAFLN
jgi:catechol 2,3-dioxygenase-like lactoylglutathione lyase family enzyme